MLSDYNHPANERWDWMVVSRYKGNLKRGQVAGRIAMVTVHQTIWSKDLELQCNKDIGREAVAHDLRGLSEHQRILLYKTVAT